MYLYSASEYSTSMHSDGSPPLSQVYPFGINHSRVINITSINMIAAKPFSVFSIRSSRVASTLVQHCTYCSSHFTRLNTVKDSAMTNISPSVAH